MRATRFAVASLVVLVAAVPAHAQRKKPSKDPALAGTFSELLGRFGFSISESNRGGVGSSFAGATTSVFQQSNPSTPCTSAKQFQNAASYVPLLAIDWTNDVTELTSGMTFSTGAGGSYQVAVSGSTQIPGGNPGTSVFSGTMTYPDSMFVFCEVWNAANTAKVDGCPLLILGPVMGKQSAGWGGYGVSQSAGLTRARGSLAASTTYTLRVGIAGEGSATAPNMQFCAWMVTVDTN